MRVLTKGEVKMNKRLMRVMAMLLTVAMIVCNSGSFVYADENDTDPIVATDDLSEGEALPNEVSAEETETESDSTEEGTDELENYEGASDGRLIDSDRLFYRNLTVDEMEAKDAASMDDEEVREASEGDDYAANEVIALCETEDEAEEIAKAYAESTGYTVKVDSFSHRVALLKIYGQPVKKRLEEYVGTDNLSSVESFVKLGSDTSNNLPAVYPNYYREAYSVGNSANEEEFDDPMLKEDSEVYSGMYQWYHNIVNDKFIWKKIDINEDDMGDKLSTVHVAVLDSGINYEHTELSDVMSSHKNYIEASHDGNGEQTPYEADGGDTQGHGTNVAGIIGNIANNGVGGRGVAAGVKIDSYRVLNRDCSGTDYEIAKGINAVVDDKRGGINIRVINMSLGGSYYNGLYDEPFEDAREENILVIAAAGNDNNAANHYPASNPGVMSVAALNEDYEKSDFSNYGATVDIAAPGGESKLDYASSTFGRSNPLWASGKKELSSGMKTIDGQNYTGMNGTSQATPVVSGCAALLFAQHPEYTPDQVEAILEATARPLKSKYQIGAGCVDIAAAMEIDTSVPKPVASIQSGKIDSGDEIIITMPDDFEYSDYVIVYYTLNGKDPLGAKTKAEDIKTCKPGDKVLAEGAGKVSLCMRAVLFGIESDQVTYTYAFNDSDVEEITVRVPGNIEVNANNSGSNVAFGEQMVIAEGKTLRLTASVFPTYAKNKKLIWTSDNKDIATVDTNGNLKGINKGSTTISATSADGEVKASIPVKVQQVSEQVIINKDLINLVIGDTEKHNLTSSEISVYPAGVSQKVCLESSNDKIAVIKEQDDGKQYIEAVSVGDAIITVTTTDGTNISDSVPVHVAAKVKSIIISDPSGNNIIAKGQWFAPSVEINGNSEVTEDYDIGWKVINPSGIESYFDISDGKIRIAQGYSGSIPNEIVIQAYSGEITSNQLTLKLCAPAEDILLSERGYDFYYGNRYYYTSYPQDLSELFNVSPSTAYEKLTYSCMNKSGIKIKSDGHAVFEKTGYYTIKAETVDGTDFSKEIQVYATARENSVEGIRCKSGNAIVYPGKTIEMEPILTKSGGLPSYLRFGFLDAYNKFYTEYDYLKVSGRKVKGTDELKNVVPGKKQSIHFVDCYWGSDWYAAAIELYPAGTSSVVLEYDDAETAGKTFTIKPDSSGQITASSLPSNACQKYYTYKSSNTKVLTVDNSGKVRAIANGKATVTVTAGDGSGKTAKINYVVARVADSIEITSKTNAFRVIPGKSLNLVATVKPSDTVDKKIKWSITDGKEYAKINASSGKLDAIAPGVVKVKAEISSQPDVFKEQPITVVPATDGITIDDPSVAKNGLTLYSEAKGSCKNSDTFSFTVKSKTDGKPASAPVVTSSNSNMLDVELVGVPSESGNQITYTYRVTGEGEKSGNAKANIVANDGSGKNASVNVKVLVPVNGLSISTPGGITTVTPGKSLKLSATVNKTASNKSVVWEFESESDEQKARETLGVDIEKFKNSGIISVKDPQDNGDFTVKATAADGSGTTDSLKIYIRKKAVTDVSIKESEAGPIVKTCKLGTYLSPSDETRVDDFAVKRSFYVDILSATKTETAASGEYQSKVVVSSSNEAIAKAKIDSGDPSKLLVYTYDADESYKSSKTGTVKITVKAADGSNKSATLSVTVAEPARTIYISADKSTRVIAANAKITMKATAQSSATNKKVMWTLGEEVDSSIATISSSGAVSPNKNLPSKSEITVVATAADGSGVSSNESLTLYPAQDKIVYSNDTVNVSSLQMSVGDTKEITIKGCPGAYADYLTTYKTGPIRVQYKDKGEDKTVISITAVKKGSSTITATARDASGKKGTLKVDVK